MSSSTGTGMGMGNRGGGAERRAPRGTVVVLPTATRSERVTTIRPTAYRREREESSGTRTRGAVEERKEDSGRRGVVRGRGTYVTAGGAAAAASRSRAGAPTSRDYQESGADYRDAPRPSGRTARGGAGRGRSAPPAPAVAGAWASKNLKSTLQSTGGAPASSAAGPSRR